MTRHPTPDIDGEGVGWAIAGLVASLLIGIAVEPFRRTIGLENVVMTYLLVVVLTAVIGGRTAGLWSAVAAALSYDFFLTTPYHQLAIDSAAQVITVALLLGTGLVASLAGRARRRLTVEADTQAGIIRLLSTITHAAAAGENTDRLAGEGIHTLLDARRVVIRRGDPDHEVVVADIGEADAPLDIDHLTRLDAEGHIVDGRSWPPNGSVVRWLRPHQGVVLQLVRRQRPRGTLLVIFRQGYWLPPVTRLAMAAVAHTLATATGPAVSHDQ